MTEQTIKNTSPVAQNFKDIIPLSKFNQEISKFPTVSALRQYYFYNQDNFADEVVLKISGRLYLRLPELWAWIEKQNNTDVA